MAEISFDKRNYRIHNDKNKELIKKSLDDCGSGRSIVIDNEGEIIAGNGVYEAWGDRPVKVVETDGSELVVVKRTDLKTDDYKRKQLAVMDNSSSDTSEFDIPLLRNDFDDETLAEFGVDIPNVDFSYEEEALEKESEGVNKKLLKCPVCGHINEEKAFKTYADTD